MRYLKWIFLIIKAIIFHKTTYFLSFSKKADKKWYINFPKWPLANYHLMMVAGADTLLEILHNGTNHVFLKVKVSNKNYNLADSIKLVKTSSTLIGGAYYRLENPPSNWSRENLWLCPVTLAVLGQYPKYIFIEKK